MSKLIQNPTHYRLMGTLRAIGPYLRDGQCREGFYLFDCLSVCVDDEKSPEQREFWGWWLELEQIESGFRAKYHLGKYDVNGDWVKDTLTDEVLNDVDKSHQVFHQKLTDTLSKKFELNVEFHDDSMVFSK